MQSRAETLMMMRAPPQMGRMHSGGKGMASSAIPYKRTPPSWAKATPKDVEEHVCKLAKKGLAPSQVSQGHRGPGARG
jgi:hypothetical protein